MREQALADLPIAGAYAAHRADRIARSAMFDDRLAAHPCTHFRLRFAACHSGSCARSI